MNIFTINNKVFSSNSTLILNLPCAVSYFNRWAFVLASPKSLIATISISLRSCVHVKPKYVSTYTAKSIYTNFYRHIKTPKILNFNSIKNYLLSILRQFLIRSSSVILKCSNKSFPGPDSPKLSTPKTSHLPPHTYTKNLLRQLQLLSSALYLAINLSYIQMIVYRKH